MLGNETPVSGAVLGHLPRPAEVGSRSGGQREIAGAGRLKQLQQLARGIWHGGLPGAREKVAVFELDISAQPQWIATVGLVSNETQRLS